jgi:nitric oxide reductase large subunit
VLHVAGLVLWLAAALLAQGLLIAARRGDEARQLAVRRRVLPVVLAEHLAFVIGLAAGVLLLLHRHWGLGHARGLAVKIGLTLFLLVPLEAMHAWIAHGWIARGLRQTPAPPLSKDLVRGIGMDDMLRALAAPLLAASVPLLVWLSLRKPW